MPKLTEKKKQMLMEMSREAIYEAVVELLNNEGLDGVTMHIVAKKAGMATGSLYNYFKNKDDIINFVDARLFAHLFEDLGKNLNKSTAIENLEAFLRTCYQFGKTNDTLFCVLQRARIEEKIDASTRVERESLLIQRIQEIVQSGINNGEFAKIDPEEAGKFILSVIIGTSWMGVTWVGLDPVADSKKLVNIFRPYLTQNN